MDERSASLEFRLKHASGLGLGHQQFVAEAPNESDIWLISFDETPETP